jgi:hypothetical protein
MFYNLLTILLDIFILNIGIWNIIYILSIFYIDNYYYKLTGIFINLYLLNLKPYLDNSTKNKTNIINELYFKRKNGKVIFKNKKNDYVKQCIYCYHPHGQIPLCLVGIFTTQFFNNSICLVSSILFKIPFINLFICLTKNIDSVHKKNFDLHLQNGKNIILCPGGVDEMLVCKPYTNEIHISKKHKGFIKKAILAGIPIVPIYSFGENNLCINRLKYIEKIFYKYLKINIPGILTNNYFIPISSRINNVCIVGSPIDIKKELIPSQENIKNIENLYYKSLYELFNDNKELYGDINDKMIFH